MKGACFPFFMKHYHGMIGQNEDAFFRETPSGRIIIAKYNREKAQKREPTEKELKLRAKFKQAHTEAINALMIAETRREIEEEFKAQSKYKTLIGYATAKMYALITD